MAGYFDPAYFDPAYFDVAGQAPAVVLGASATVEVPARPSAVVTVPDTAEADVE